MSLILDALRKSEAERRRGELPAFALELPPGHARTLPVRLAWLVAPLVLVAAAATWWIVQRATAPVPAAAEPPVVTVPAVEAEPRRQAETQPARRALPPAPEGEPVEAAPTPVEAAPASAVSVPSPVSAADPEPVALADLTADERRALPPLDLSMHLWSEDPARRFVILDGRRLAEGDRIGAAVVARIDPDGVILAADGRRIRLPLP